MSLPKLYMKIGRVKINNFRSISSTEFEMSGGKVALVGGNESGKSNVLLAIQKFLNQEKFIPEDKYQLSKDEPEIEIDFSNFTEPETTELCKLLQKDSIGILTIKRGAENYEIVSPTLPIEPIITTQEKPVQENSVAQEKPIEPQVAANRVSSREQITTEIKKLIPHAVSIRSVQGLIKGKNIPVAELFPDKSTPITKPVLTDNELKTIHNFLSLGEITSDNITDEDSGKSFHTLNQKAATIAQKLSASWKQERVEIRMCADGANLVIEMKDCGNVPDGEEGLDSSKWIWTYPEDRSYGFQWFVTFYSTYLYGLEQSKNAIFLIDEAGGALNKRAQQDLLNEFDKLTADDKNSQIIYATHSKYMVKWDFRNDVYAVIKNRGKGTEVSSKWWSKYKQDILPPPLDELDVTWSNDLLAHDNLIVEGPVDLEVLRRLKTIFQDSNIPEDPFRQFKLIPGMGRFNSMIELGKACKFHKKKSLLLFDADPDGISGESEAKRSNLESANINTLSNAPTQKIFSIEDLLPRKIFFKYTNEAGKEVFDEKWEQIGHIQQINTLGLIEALKKRLTNVSGFTEKQANNFLRDRKYQIVMNVLQKCTIESFSIEQIEAIRALFNNLNNILTRIR